MPGFEKNDWSRYLNGGTSQYNFAYKSEAPPTIVEANPHPVPMATEAEAEAEAGASVQSRKNNKNNKVTIPTQKGGKRKSKHRRSHVQKNKRRRTHRK